MWQPERGGAYAISAAARDMVRLFNAVVEGLRRIAALCRERPQLKCIDYPVFTSRLLKALGMSDYEIRRVWRAARHREVVGGLVLYSYMGTSFRLVARTAMGVAYHHDPTTTPVDRIDCLVLGDECSETPRCNSFYLYLDGRIEGAAMVLNVSYIAGLLARTSPGVLDKMLGIGEKALQGPFEERRSLRLLVEEAARVVAEEEPILSLVLPRVPRGLDELLHLSPLARRLYMASGGGDLRA